jgi:glycosyltransferase involved in cell wall biosynthesis
MKKNNICISIIIPVYNRLEYLDHAIQSVIHQDNQSWELVISDDASSEMTAEYLSSLQNNEKIKVYRNSKNIGLFPNLNSAIDKSKGSYVLLLCSDDVLHTNCIQSCINLASNHPNTDLFLSAFDMFDQDSQFIPSASIFYYDQFVESTVQEFHTEEILPILMRFGSINGNLTGMFFNRKLWEKVGNFRNDWQHAADWEWLYRACQQTNVLISKKTIACVRQHSKQLSGTNFYNLSNSLEVIDMLVTLMNNPLVNKVQSSDKWFYDRLQSQLWFALKFLVKGNISSGWKIFRKIFDNSNILLVLIAMILWLPVRWQIYKKKIMPIPPK